MSHCLVTGRLLMHLRSDVCDLQRHIDLRHVSEDAFGQQQVVLSHFYQISQTRDEHSKLVVLSSGL